MRLTTFIILCFSGFIFIGCTQQINENVKPPSDLIPYDTMVDILVDLRLMDAELVMEQRNSSAKLNDLKYYLHNSILTKYHITREQFKASFDYYESDLGVMDRMFADAITKLSKLKSETDHDEK